MAADIFGQRVERDIGTVLDRALEDRAEQSVVAGNDRSMPLPFSDFRRAHELSQTGRTRGKIVLALRNADGTIAG